MDISHTDANSLATKAGGTVTATIASGTTVDQLVTLRTPNGSDNEVNAYTITIANGDATGSTAAEFNTINSATSVAINASAVTALSGTASDIATLMLAATDTNQFTGTSFDSVAANGLSITGTAIDVTDLNNALSLSLIHI